MRQVTRGKVTIDYCKKCGGIWLDKGEMEKIIVMQHKAMEKEKKLFEKQEKEIGKLKKQQAKEKKRR